MRRHRIVAALSVAFLIGACSSGGTPAPAGMSAAVTIPSVGPGSSVPTASGIPGRLALPSAPDITDAGVIDGAMVISIARPHASEAVEYYQLRVNGGEWRTLDASEWRPAQGGAGIVFTLSDPPLEAGQAALVRLRAANASGFGDLSRAVSISIGLTDANAGTVDSGPADVDTALGLSGPARTVPAAHPAQQTIVIIVEVLAALGLVSIGIFIGWRLRRS